MTQITLDLVTDALQRSDPIRTANARAQLLALAGVVGDDNVASAEFSAVLASERELPASTSSSPQLSSVRHPDNADNADDVGPSRLSAEIGIEASRPIEVGASPGDGDPSQAARAFEAFVLTSLVKSMLPPSGSFFGSGAGTGIWRSMLAEKLAEEIAKSGGIGVADLLPKQVDGQIGTVALTESATGSGLYRGIEAVPAIPSTSAFVRSSQAD